MALSSRQFSILTLLFWISGAAVLGLEIIWARQLQRLMGSSSWAVAGVLCAFLAGMGGGALVADRILRRGQKPLRLYAAAEFALAACALLLSFLLPRFGGLLRLPAGDLLLIAAVAIAVAPAGATLPCTNDSVVNQLSARRDETGIFAAARGDCPRLGATT